MKQRAYVVTGFASPEKAVLWYDQENKQYFKTKVNDQCLPVYIELYSKTDKLLASSMNPTKPQVSEAFIESYCKNQPDEVMLVVEDINKPVIRKNNTVIIYKIRNTFTRDEVVKLFTELTLVDAETVHTYLDYL